MIDKIYKYNNIMFKNLDEMSEYIRNNNISLDYENAFCEDGIKFKDIKIKDEKNEDENMIKENDKKKFVRYSYKDKKGNIKNYEYEVIINTEKQKGYANKYFNNHKDEYLKKIDCIYCDCKISKCNLNIHYKTQKHINNIIKYNNN